MMIDQILTFLNHKYAASHGGPIESNTALLSSGLVDSVAALELVDELEEKFGFEFAPHEVSQENLDTAERIAQYVALKTAA